MERTTYNRPVSRMSNIDAETIERIEELEEDRKQHLRDLCLWCGLSLCFGICFGMFIVTGWKL